MPPILFDFPETATARDIMATAARLRRSNCSVEQAGWTLNYLLRDAQPKLERKARLELVNVLLEQQED